MSAPSRPLRVLLLNEFFYPDNQGGTATATANIAQVLSREYGAKVDVITTHHAYRDPAIRYDRREEWGPISIHRVASPNWLRASTLKRLAGNVLFAVGAAVKSLSIAKPDVVLVTTAPLTLPIAARLLKGLRGVPYAYLIYDLDPDRTVALGLQGPDSRQVKVLGKVQKKWLQGADRVLAIGRCMRQLLINRYDLKQERVVVAEVGADPNVVKPLEKETKFRAENGLTGFVALYSGNFGQYHDFDAILEAAEKLRDTRTDITFVLVGGGHKKGEIESAIRDRKLTNVRLLPFVPEEMLADMLASADIHLVTLEAGMEGICVPSKFYTCLASGRPVLAIMPEATEVTMVVKEHETGWHCLPGDVPTLMASLEDAAAHPDESARRGKNARRVFEDLYNTTTIARKIYATLESCVKK